MNLTKENYEFLMFELLEGNLNESEKNALMEQINKDTFYQQEWTLMQHAVVFPDNRIIMNNKQGMLKPEGRIITFLSFNSFAKIAASLLLIGIAAWWYYANNSIITQVVYNPVNTDTPEVKIIEKPVERKKDVKQIQGDNRKQIVSITNPNQTIKSKEQIIVQVNDSALPIALPEILLIRPLENEGISYNIGPNETLTTGTLDIEKPKTKELNKIGLILVQADNVRNTVSEYWNDIPNLKLKVTPKFKNNNRSIGFELKGETIYANALLEIK